MRGGGHQNTRLGRSSCLSRDALNFCLFHCREMRISRGVAGQSRADARENYHFFAVFCYFKQINRIYFLSQVKITFDSGITRRA